MIWLRHCLLKYFQYCSVSQLVKPNLYKKKTLGNLTYIKFLRLNKGSRIPDPQHKRIKNSWPSIKRSETSDTQQKDEEFLTLSKWPVIQNKGMRNSCVGMDDSIKMKSGITSQGGYSYRYLTTKFIKQDFKASTVIFPNLSVLVNSNPYSIIEHLSTLSVHSINVLLTWCLAILQGLL